jgi:type I restriction enzyme S subunit
LTESWREGKNLPEWGDATVDDVIEDLMYGTSHKCDYNIKNGIPVLRIPNVSSGKLDLMDLKYACLESKESKKLSLKLATY